MQLVPHALLVHRPGQLRDDRATAMVRSGAASRVSVASNRVELLSLLGDAAASGSSEPLLVVIAHDPPWIDGIDLARTLHRIVDASGQDRERHVVLVDAEDAASAGEAVRAGASGVVLAPTSTHELVATVTSVASGSYVVPRTAAGRLAPLAPRPPQERLSSRELEVLAALARGMTNSEIATDLYVSRETVKTHVAHVLRKLGVADRHAAAARGLALGLLEPAGSRGAASDDRSPTTPGEEGDDEVDARFALAHARGHDGRASCES